MCGKEKGTCRYCWRLIENLISIHLQYVKLEVQISDLKYLQNYRGSFEICWKPFVEMFNFMLEFQLPDMRYVFHEVYEATKKYSKMSKESQIKNLRGGHHTVVVQISKLGEAFLVGLIQSDLKWLHQSAQGLQRTASLWRQWSVGNYGTSAIDLDTIKSFLWQNLKIFFQSWRD